MIGDAAGIGPEVCVKAAAAASVRGVCQPVLIGSVEVIRHAAAAMPDRPVVRLIEAAMTQPPEEGVVSVIDPGGYDWSRFKVGEPTANAGHAVLRWIDAAQALGRQGAIDGLVLGPVNSDSLKLDGKVLNIDDLQPPGTFMFRVSGNLRVVPLTEHIPMRLVCETVTTERVLALVLLLREHLVRWGIAEPRIGVAGLNPHAMFEEDVAEIAPAVAQARARGVTVEGPIAPDSIFRMALEGRFDAVVTMYHDQGQIAVKTAAFAGACTVYMGLPYVMLNVPHGTAFDIAGRGIARPESMAAAFRTAAALASGKGFLSAD